MRVRCMCNTAVEESLTVGKYYYVMDEFTNTYVVIDDNGCRTYHSKTRFDKIMTNRMPLSPEDKAMEHWVEVDRRNNSNGN